MNPLVIDHVSYRYTRKADALHDVSLSVPRGAVLGLLGANGAGKSTLLQCCAGLRTPTSGGVQVCGLPTADRAAIVRGHLTYVAAGQPLPTQMTVDALVRWVAPLHARWDSAFASALRERLALHGDQRVGGLSRGARMKLALLLALAPRPDVLILDEPLSGLDVPSRDDVLRNVLSAVAERGTTVVLASHEITEIETVVDHVAMLREGKLVLADRLDALQSRYQRVTLVGEPEALDAMVRESRFVSALRSGRVLSLVVDTEHTSIPGDGADAANGVARTEVAALPLRELYLTVAHGTAAAPSMEALV
jgi:ABC-2 type transport system ATP-binding protein